MRRAVGFRFRRSIKIIPGVRWNLGKRSSSFSVGRRGFTVNLSKRGARETIVLAIAGPRHGGFRLTLFAAAAYAAMIAVFFIFNNPVNQALNGWTAATLPTHWPAYRLRREIGHAIAALLSVLAWAALIAARRRR